MAINLLSLAAIKAGVSNIISELKTTSGRGWFGMNILFVSIALCGGYRELV